MKLLSESAAWREVARRHAEQAPLFCASLCFCADDLLLGGRISEEMAEAMEERILSHQRADRVGSASGWSFDGGDFAVRVLAALFLSLEAADDAKRSPSPLAQTSRPDNA